MLYGTPTRATNRAAAGGGLALFGFALTGALSYGRRGESRPLRGHPTISGHHRVPARPREPQRTAQLFAQGLAALIVLALTTLVGFFIVAEAQRARAAAEPAADPSAALTSRSTDGAPLTLQEIFPSSAAPAGYRIALTHADSDCAAATTGAVGTLLAQHGCSQVVRAALSAPYGDYQVTAGIFNLSDATGAQDVDGRLRRLVETGDGNFATLPSSGAAPATLQVGWRARGHYLLYCVITRPGGKLVTSDDPYASRITADVVDAYLGDTVLARRSSG
jgi:hypothetical protein